MNSSRVGNLRLIVVLVFVALVVPACLFGQQPGEAWERIGLMSANISAIGVSPGYNTDQTIFVGVREGGLWKGVRNESTYGKVTFSWSRVTVLPTSCTVTAIAFHPAFAIGQSNPMFVGTDEGMVYSSSDCFESIYAQKILTLRGTPPQPPVPVIGMTAWDPLADPAQTHLFIGTKGGGIFKSTNLLNSDPERFNDNFMDDCRGIAREGNNIYAVFMMGLDCAVSLCDGTATSFSWTTKGQWFGAGFIPCALDMKSTWYKHYCWIGTENRGIIYTDDITATSPVWGLACDGSGNDVEYRVNVLLSSPGDPFVGTCWEGRSDGLFKTNNSFLPGYCTADQSYRPPIQALAFSPSFGSEAPGYHEAFIGTETGLFLYSESTSVQSGQSRAPASIPINDLALSEGGPPGTWAAGSGGLYRNTVQQKFIEYNAFYGGTPNVAAVAFPPSYSPTGACPGNASTVFMADRFAGVYRSTDGGNTWVLLSSGWPTSIAVNDIAVSPSYATDSTVYAATTNGLYRWSDPGSWQRTPDGFPTGVEVTRVALPNNFLLGGATVANNVLAFSVANSTAQNNGLYYSSDGGYSAMHFLYATDSDITAISFSPSYNGDTDQFLFYSRATGGAYYTSHFDGITEIASWCSCGAGLDPDVRDLQASPQIDSTYIYLSAATSTGPYLCPFPRTNDSDTAYCALSFYNWIPDWSFSTPSGCPDTLCVSWGLLGNGQKAAVGTAQDGVYFSSDGGFSFGTSGTGYRTLPDDVWATVPSQRSDSVLFSSSPSNGIFVSTDGGNSFWPWNQGNGFCFEGAKGLGTIMSRDCSFTNVDAVWAGAPDTTTGNQGLCYRFVEWDSAAGRYNFDYSLWGPCSVGTGQFEHIETAGGIGQTWPAWAISNTKGFYASTDCYGYQWNLEDPGNLSGSYLAFGKDLTAIPALSSGSPTGSQSLGSGEWDYYFIYAPVGTQNIRIMLTDLGGDPDLYVRYGALPNTSSDYYSNYSSPHDEFICVNPAIEGIWYIGVYGYSSGTTYNMTVTLDGGCVYPMSLSDASYRPRRNKSLPQAFETGPDPLGPSASIIWGTVSGTGVNKGTSSTFIVPGPMETTWTPRNGSGWGYLGDLDTQTVIQLENGDLLCGTNGHLYISRYPDEGSTTWSPIGECIAGTPSWNVKDFLETVDGELLMAMEGTGGTGGVWLSGNGGICWMRITGGFDPADQKLEDLVMDSASHGYAAYYGSTDGTGLYSRSITADWPPEPSYLSATSAAASGGTTITVNGQYFTNYCVTGDPYDCPYQEMPVVWFGGTPVTATYISDTQLSVTTPAHEPGTVVVTVMNPDTRTGSCSPNCFFTFTDDGSEGKELMITQSGGMNILEWSPDGTATAQRSTSPQFDANLKSTTAISSPWADPDSYAATDANTYYYRLK